MNKTSLKRKESAYIQDTYKNIEEGYLLNYYFSNYPSSFKKRKLGEGIVFVADNWNDYGYRTLFHAFLVLNGKDSPQEIGMVNIGVKDKEVLNTINYLIHNEIVGRIVSQFPDEVFLLESLDYYSNLKKGFRDKNLQEQVFKETNDIAFNNELFQNIKELKVLNTSFFRNQLPSSIKQLHRYTHGGPKFINYNWELKFRRKADHPSLKIKNDINSIIPNNIFAIVGNNGVGKTSLLKDIIIATSEYGEFVDSKFLPEGQVGLFDDIFSINETDVLREISNLVFVSFSSFDTFDEKLVNLFKTKYKFVGNRKKDDFNSIIDPKSFGQQIEVDLEWVFYNPDNRAFFKKIMNIFSWDKQLNSFVNDVEKTSFTDDSEGLRSKIQERSESLSSGQKMILSTIGNLIKVARENSMFLIDEPELYLHAPFILSLIMAIYEIATKTNSVCIIATHSAIVLQELPKENVFIIKALGKNKAFKNPSIETFGTNTQTITDELFGMDIRATGYYKILKEIVEKEPQKIDELMNSGHLGTDAILYLTALRGDF